MLKRGYDSKVIMKITGHSTDSAFQKYVKLSPEDAANNVLSQDKQTESTLPAPVDLVKAITTEVLSSLSISTIPSKKEAEILDRLNKIEHTLQQIKDYIMPDKIGLIVETISQHIAIGTTFNLDSLIKSLIGKECLMPCAAEINR